MNLLVAATSLVHPDDFDTGVVAGELLEPDVMCDKDRFTTWPGVCGCGRSFIGMSSGQRVTTALITDVDITRDELTTLITEKHPDADTDEVTGMVDDLVDYGQQLPPGTTARIWRYQLEVRP